MAIKPVEEIVLEDQDTYLTGNNYVCNNGVVTRKPPHSSPFKGVEEILYCQDSRQCNQKVVCRESRVKFCVAGYDLGGIETLTTYEVKNGTNETL